ncbi:Thioredoxin domain-containing protein 5 [Anthophora plagiata]
MNTIMLNSVMLKKRIFLLVFLLSQVNSEEEDHVQAVQYTSTNFSTEIKKKDHFVMFYDPWFSTCIKLEPIWDQLADISHKNYNINIAKVDCVSDSNLCKSHHVTYYPTLKYFKAGEERGQEYTGETTLSALLSVISYINQGEGTTFEIEDVVPSPPKPLNGLLELTEDTFDKHVSTGYHFVKFYAPWCGHCQKLAPTWEELANSLRNNNFVSISKIDCTQHHSICGQFEIKGYPTLLWIKDGKKVDQYTGQRTHEELRAYTSKMLGKVDDQVNVKTENLESTTPNVLSLTRESFKHNIENGVSFVKFFAPWCGHCKRLAPIWKDLEKKFLTNDNVNIIKVDCTLDVSKSLCDEQEVDSFPTLHLYRDGYKLSEYKGARNLDDLYEFVMNYVQPRDEL